jgi:hypothetical protein
MTFKIRLATAEDIPALQDLIRASVAALSADYYSSGQIASALAHIFGVDSQLISDGTYFVAEVEKQIAGSGGWSKRQTLFGGDQLKLSQKDPLLDPATQAARIRAFYVHPAMVKARHWQPSPESLRRRRTHCRVPASRVSRDAPGSPFLFSARLPER